MVNHTLPLPSRLDAQPVLSLVRLIALLRNKHKDCRVENGIRIDSRVNIPAIASLDSRKYRGQVMVSTIRKAKEGIKRRQRLHSKLYSYNAKLAREYAAKRHSGVCRTSKKLAEPIYARTLAYIKAKLKLRWSPEQISLRIDALLADQTLKDDDGWTGDMGLRPVSHMAIYRYIYGLNGNEREESN